MINYRQVLQTEESLDPQDWEGHKALAHQMVEDVFSFLSNISDEPVWTKPPQEVKDCLSQPLPREKQDLKSVYLAFQKNILPYRKGNVHPMFFSWVEGNGTLTGALADLLASAMNSNLAIGDHGAVYVEHQVLNWCKEMVGFPQTASGTLVSGASVANITGLTVGRNSFRKGNIKQQGLKTEQQQLVMYCSVETHNCINKAAEVLGIGSDFLRKIPVNKLYQIDVDALELRIEQDRENGLLPFCIVGNAGTVNTGAIDPLDELATICEREGLWFHVDGAIGALAYLLPEYVPPLKGMEKADSLALDLHKWLYVNYEAACILVKNPDLHRNAFSQQASYLTRHERGLAAGPDSFSNYGLELSRGFKSLKVWMMLKEHGVSKYERLIRQNIAQAMYMAEKVTGTEFLQLLTPVSLNIVCFRYNPGGMNMEDLNILNKELLMRLQEQGIAAPSYTVLNGQYAIRMSITNYRTRCTHLDLVVRSVLELGKTIHEEKLESVSGTY